MLPPEWNTRSEKRRTGIEGHRKRLDGLKALLLASLVIWMLVVGLSAVRTVLEHVKCGELSYLLEEK